MSAAQDGRLGRYLIVGTLGRGAMGTVYDGRDPVIDRRVAIKTIPLASAAEDAEAADELARFKREAQAAGRLQHPNIVGVYEYNETETIAFIVMEFVDGTTLKAVLDRGERMKPEEAVRLMRELLAALQYSHERGVVHRDIKPANVMLTKAGTVKIADFGIARIESSSLTQAGTIMGTPAYMSPEQFMGQTVDARTDIYSAGVLLYQLLTGERPFEGSMTAIMHKVLNTVPPRPSEMSVTSPAGLDAVVATAMAKRPEQRFQSAAEFAQALTAALTAPPPAPVVEAPAAEDGDATVVAKTAPPARPEPPLRPAPPPAPPKAVPAAAAAAAPAPSRSRAPLLAGAAVVVVALAGGGYFALRPSAPPPDAPAKPAVASPEPAPEPAPPATPPASPPASAAAKPAAEAVPPPAASPPAFSPPAASPRSTEPASPASPPPAATAVNPPAPAVPAVPPSPSPATMAESPPPTAAPSPPPAPSPAPTPPAAVVAVPPPSPAAPSPPPPAPKIVAPAPQLVANPPPTPQPPATHVTMAETPAALRAAVRAAIAPVGCALLGGDVGAGDAVRIDGVVPAEKAAALSAAVTDAAPAASTDLAVATFTGPYCGLLDTLRPLAAGFAQSGSGLAVGLKTGSAALRKDAYMIPRIVMPSWPAYLTLDYFQSDGTMAHLAPAADAHPHEYPAHDVVMLGDPASGAPGWQVGEPYGTDMMVAIASSRPLFAKPRPDTDTPATYLAALRGAIETARRHGDRVAASATVVRTVQK